MCRILAMWGLREQAELLDQLTKAFVDACSSDPHLERIAGVRCHCDGWGFVGVFASDGGVQVVWERFYSPSIEEHRVTLAEATRRIVSLARESRDFTVILHCRKASKTEPIGIAHSHPYYVETSYYDVFFAHNGGFRKDDLALILEKPAHLYTDSALGAQLYARFLEMGGEALDALRRLAFYTRTAFNTVSVLVERTTGRAALTYSALTCSSDEARVNYYRVYLSVGREYFIYASSTVAEHDAASVVKWEALETVGAGRIGFFEKGMHVNQVIRCPPQLS